MAWSTVAMASVAVTTTAAAVVAVIASPTFDIGSFVVGTAVGWVALTVCTCVVHRCSADAKA